MTVINTSSDILASVFTAEDKARLPVYQGELLMTDHGAGCYTSQTTMKRWNRKNELLADAAERAAVLADIIGAVPYPGEALKQHWIRFIWHQFHDDLTGTSIPEAYEYSWNDEILSLKGFAGILQHSISAIAQAMDTDIKGIPILVYNPLSFSREDIVEGIVRFDKLPPAVKVFDSEGREVPSQFEIAGANSVKVVFLAKAPAIGISIYEVRESLAGYPHKTGLEAGANYLENPYYRVSVNSQGDIASILDKLSGRELLSQPIRLQLLEDIPEEWAAWEIDYSDIMAEAKAVVGGEPVIKIDENGPVRVTMEIARQCGDSQFLQRISLAAGEAGRQVVFDNQIDWYERETLLKAAFTSTAANDSVTYDLGCGVISRAVNTPRLYEVPAQQWADLTSSDGSFGMAVLNDCKYGWDHPDKNTIRLTLIHTPGIVSSRWEWVGDQRTMDFGQHRFKFAVVGHKGDWRDGFIHFEAAKLNQPLLAFQTEKHWGSLGKKCALLEVTEADRDSYSPAYGILVKAVKKAENSEEIIVRLQELEGKFHHNVKVDFNWLLKQAFAADGSEQHLSQRSPLIRAVALSIYPYQINTIAVKIKKPDVKLPKLEYASVPLHYNLDGFTSDDDYTDGDLDGEGNTISADLMPDKIIHNEIEYALGPKKKGALNVIKSSGQEIHFRNKDFQKLCLLAASTGEPSAAEFFIGGRSYTCNIPEYRQKTGQWNNRIVSGKLADNKENILPSYIDPSIIAWNGTHLHNAAKGNCAYQFSNLFLLSFDLEKNDNKLKLPDNPHVKIFAASLVKNLPAEVTPLQPLFDVADNAFALIEPEADKFLQNTRIRLSSPFPGAIIHYTLDGSVPAESSPIYTKPFILTESTLICARAFVPGMKDEHITRTKVTKLIPREPVNTAGLKTGLSCEYYEGDWQKLPDFNRLEVKKRQIMKEITFPDFIPKEYFALKFSGYIKIPQDEVYKFYSSSDDGSDLFIGDVKVIDNDGIHGEWEESGEIALKAGMHTITVIMFQRRGGKALQVSIESPAMKKHVISQEMLFHLD